MVTVTSDWCESEITAMQNFLVADGGSASACYTEVEQDFRTINFAGYANQSTILFQLDEA